MTNKTTIHAYATFAHNYDQAIVDFWANFPKDFLEKFVAGLPGRRVLSLGSGSGRDALLLRQLGLEVVCVDAADSMVAITTGLGFESYVATFEEMSFDNNSFDGVWAHGSLLHITSTAARDVLKRLHVMLKPSSSLAVGVIQGDGEAMIGHEIMPNTARFFQFYQSHSLQALIEPLGFELIHQKDYVLPYDTFLNHIYKKRDEILE